MCRGRFEGILDAFDIQSRVGLWESKAHFPHNMGRKSRFSSIPILFIASGARRTFNTFGRFGIATSKDANIGGDVRTKVRRVAWWILGLLNNIKFFFSIPSWSFLGQLIRETLPLLLHCHHQLVAECPSPIYHMLLNLCRVCHRWG